MEHHFRILLSHKELAAIRAIAESVWPPTFREILSPEQITYMMKMMYGPEVLEREFDRGIYFEVLSMDGEDAGFISYGHCEHLPDAVKLHKCYLLEKFQGQGHGSAMLRHAALAARQMKAKYLRLNVNKHNSKAIRAYQRNGFVTVESVKNDIGAGFFMDDFVMQKTL